jgi:hypothetical protein
MHKSREKMRTRNFFQSDRENYRADNEPSFVYIDSSKQKAPILTELQYRLLIVTSSIIWAIPIFIAWAVNFEIKLTQDFVVALSGSSVEIAALSLAVLGILHDMNRADRFFKFGLFLVAFQFGIVVLDGYWIAATWQDFYSEPHQFTVYVLGVISVEVLLQINWKKLLGTKGNLLRNVSLTFPFISPILIGFVPDMNQIIFLFTLFCGAFITLMVLIAITIVQIYKETSETDLNPIIELQTLRSKDELLGIERSNQLKKSVRDVLINLQEHHILNFNQGLQQAIDFVNMDIVYEELRKNGITETKSVINQAMIALSEDDPSTYYYEDNYWLLGHHEKIANQIKQISKEYPILIFDRNDKLSKKSYLGLDIEKFLVYLSNKLMIPIKVIEEYYFPFINEYIFQTDSFSNDEFCSIGFYGNRNYHPDFDFEQIRKDAFEIGEDRWMEKIINKEYFENPNEKLLRKLSIADEWEEYKKVQEDHHQKYYAQFAGTPYDKHYSRYKKIRIKRILSSRKAFPKMYNDIVFQNTCRDACYELIFEKIPKLNFGKKFSPLLIKDILLKWECLFVLLSFYLYAIVNK